MDTRQNRKLHRISAWIAGLPIFFMVSTGITLQVKNWIPWLQPPAVRGSVQGGETLPSLDLHTLLTASRSVPLAHVQSWKDIRSIDIRPVNGVARIRTRSNYEISVDLETGKVLQAAPRRVGILIELHEGVFFGDKVKYGVFLPSAILLLVLWGTGIFLLLRSRRNRTKKRGTVNEYFNKVSVWS